MLFRRLADLGSTRSNWQEVGLVLFKVHRFRSVWELPVLVQEAESSRAPTSSLRQAVCASIPKRDVMLIDFEHCLSRLQRMLVEICTDWEPPDLLTRCLKVDWQEFRRRNLLNF